MRRFGCMIVHNKRGGRVAKLGPRGPMYGQCVYSVCCTYDM